MAILDLKEKIEPFRKNATGYVKQLLSADHVVMSDGTTLQTKMDSLNSALKSAIKYVDYSVTLESNAYVTPFSYYLNKYLPTSDVEKYGIPIAATLVTSSGQAHHISLSLSYTGQYHYTAVATAGSGTMTVVYLKL